jgi:hypothetical protein
MEDEEFEDSTWNEIAERFSKLPNITIQLLKDREAQFFKIGWDAACESSPEAIVLMSNSGI